MKYWIMVFVLLVATLPGCTREETLAELGHAQEEVISSANQNESYYPMHVGNRWELNPGNYTEIKDTLRIIRTSKMTTRTFKKLLCKA